MQFKNMEDTNNNTVAVVFVTTMVGAIGDAGSVIQGDVAMEHIAVCWLHAKRMKMGNKCL